MGTGAITPYIDVAQLVLYVFWLFFFILIFWLHRETKREGYPLETHREGERLIGFPNMPPPKTFVLPHNGGTRTLPRAEPEPKRDIAIRNASSAGYPVEPTGSPMTDGVGPGTWAIRPDVPDLTHEGEPKIMPLSKLPDWSLEERDPDPRGKPVYGVDGEVGGTVVDVWMDRSEPQIRYLELEVAGTGNAEEEPAAEAETGAEASADTDSEAGESDDPTEAAATSSGPLRVLLPINFSRISGKDGSVRVKSIMAKHFADVPTLASPDQITLQEEEQIVAYYGGGYLYALPSRMEPLI
jgi:photosynthetic reaction center H subunit